MFDTQTAVAPSRFFPELGWSRVQRFGLLLATWTLPALAALAYYYLNEVVAGRPLSWRYAIVSTLPWWYTWALLTPPLLWLGRRFPIGRRSPVKLVLLVYVPAMLILLAVHAAASLLVFRATGIHDTMNAGLYEVHFTSRMHVNAIAFWTVVGAQHAYRYYHELQEKARQTAQLELMLTQANLRALKMQLNPHFLFNTLNSVSSLVRQNNNSSAVNMLGRLGSFLRMTLESKGTPEIRLSRELRFIESYLEIEQIRFGDRLSIKMQIDEAAEDLYVPNFVLQPIVENAIHHAIAPNAEAGLISISAHRVGDLLRMRVIDDGPGMTGTSFERRGVGISNTVDRLAQLYGSAADLQIRNADTGGLLVEISIPAQESPVVENLQLQPRQN